MPSRHTPHPPETRAAAELLYVIERRSSDEVCERLGIHETTLRRWRAKYGWDDRRAEAVVSIPQIVREMKDDIARTYALARKEERPLTPGERDGVFKTVTKMQQLDKGALFAQHGIQVMDLLSAYLAEHAPDLRSALVPHIVAFTARLAQSRLPA